MCCAAADWQRVCLSVTGVASVPATSVEAGRRETDAQEVWARHHVSSVKAPTISLRRLHVTDQVCRHSLSIVVFTFLFIYIFWITAERHQLGCVVHVACIRGSCYAFSFQLYNHIINSNIIILILQTCLNVDCWHEFLTFSSPSDNTLLSHNCHRVPGPVR